MTVMVLVVVPESEPVSPVGVPRLRPPELFLRAAAIPAAKLARLDTLI